MNTNSADDCSVCTGHGWVCENHPDKPWYGLMPDDFVKCCCGAGQPCAACNPCDYDNPPKKTGMQSVYANKNGVNH
jgi:hypothetical protein